MSDVEEKEADPFMQVIQDLRNRPSVSKFEEELLEMYPEVKPEPDAYWRDDDSDDSEEEDDRDNDAVDYGPVDYGDEGKFFKSTL